MFTHHRLSHIFLYPKQNNLKHCDLNPTAPYAYNSWASPKCHLPPCLVHPLHQIPPTRLYPPALPAHLKKWSVISYCETNSIMIYSHWWQATTADFGVPTSKTTWTPTTTKSALLLWDCYIQRFRNRLVTWLILITTNSSINALNHYGKDYYFNQCLAWHCGMDTEWIREFAS